MLKYVIFLLPLVAGQQLSSQPRRITANVRRIVGPAASDPVVGRLQEAGNSVNFGAPNINSNIDVTNEDGRFALSADLDFNDMSGYFFNAMIIVSVLLLVANLMGVTIFPNLTSMLESTGQLIRDKIRILSGRNADGRSLDLDTLTVMADMVDQAIVAYEMFQ